MIDISWQIYAVIFLFFSTTYALVYRWFAAQFHGYARLTTALSYALVVCPVAFIIGLNDPEFSTSVPGEIWVLLILSGITFAAANILSFIATSKIDAAEVTILSNSRILVTALLSGIFLNEFLTMQQAFGAILVVSATLIIAKSRQKQQWKIDRYFWIAIAGAAATGIGVTLEKLALNNISFASYLVFGWGLQSVAMIVLAYPERALLPAVFKDGSLKYMIVLGAMRVTAGYAFVSALVIADNAPLVSAVSAFKVPLVAIGGFIVLKERNHAGAKLVGSALAVAGLLLLI